MSLTQIMRYATGGNAFLASGLEERGNEGASAGLPRVSEICRRGLLIAGVQRVVSAGHKHLAPLEQRGGEKPGNRAKDDLLEERRVHFQFL